MATFTLNWDNSLVLAEPNAINQRASYRVKSVGGPYLTTGFTPANDLATTDVTTSRTGTENTVYQFKIEAICTAGGPTPNDNGVVEQIVFECIDPIFTDITSTEFTVTVPTSTTDMTEIKFDLRLQGDGSLVDTITSISPGNLGDTIAIFTGLTPNTAYYLEMTYYATINGVLVASDSVDYLGDVCGGNVVTYQVTTEALEVPNLMFAWNKSAAEAVNLTPTINGSFSSIDWGDGDVDTLLTHTYTTAGNYIVKMYTSTATVLEIRNLVGPSTFKVTAFTALPSTVASKLGMDNNSIPLLPSLVPNVNLIGLSVSKNELTSFPDISNNILLEDLNLSENEIVGTYDFSANVSLESILLNDNLITGLTGFTNLTALNDLEFMNNSVSVADINTALIALDNNGITNGIFISSGQTPAAVPTGLGAIAKTNLISKGWTVTTD